MSLPPAVRPGSAPVAIWRLTRRGEWEPGTLRHDERTQCWEWDPGAGPEDARADTPKALWTPPLFDAHTHVGDAFLRPEREHFPHDLKTLVAPPYGYKHRRLGEVDPAVVRDSMRTRAMEMTARGTQAHVDFREGGQAGVRLFREAERALPLRGLALGRPVTSPAQRDGWVHEVDDLLRDGADGLGLSALADLPYALAEAAADACHGMGKTLGLHHSEAQHNDIERALTLEPHILVHLAHATHDELVAVADAGILAVACPTSNLFFGLRPPLEAFCDLFHDQGLLTAFGTDNAMLGDGDLLDEARATARIVPDADLDWLVRSLSWTPWERFDAPRDERLAEGVLWGLDPKAPTQHPSELSLEEAARYLERPLHLAPRTA